MLLPRPFPLPLWRVCFSCSRTWIKPKLRSCVTTRASASWRGASWSRCRSLGPASGTSVCPPTRRCALSTSTGSCSRLWVCADITDCFSRVRCSLTRYRKRRGSRTFRGYGYLFEAAVWRNLTSVWSFCLLVSCAEDPDRHHLRCHQLSQRNGGL